MADQGHSSNQGNNRSHYFDKLDFQTNNSGMDISSDKRRQLKLSFTAGSTGGLVFPQPPAQVPIGTNCFPSLPIRNSTPSTMMETNDTTVSRQKPSVNRFPKSNQEFTQEKARERLKLCQSLQSSGKLQLAPDRTYDFTSSDLRDLGEIGRGAFGAVNKMVHRDTDTVMAVKRIRSTVDEREQKQLLMDLEVVMRSNECPAIVQFYGALFKEGDCWICMELMDTSLDKFYKFIYDRLHQTIPETILAKITVATVKALNYLKEKLKIIHRDVKPSNILLDKRGDIKLCDFGISGQLVDSIAQTRDAGCRPYMAPERIDPQRGRGYDVRSDVWSLGITLMEVATGRFPYPKWNSVFEQLYQVVQGDPPRLTVQYHSTTSNGNNNEAAGVGGGSHEGQERFTYDFVNFVNTCLIKEETQRPKYNKLLEHPFIREGERSVTDVASYVSSVLDAMTESGVTEYTADEPAQNWAEG